MMIRITWEKQVAHLVCVVRRGKGDPQEVRVVLHSEKRRIRIRIRISFQRSEEGQLESVSASIFSNAAELVSLLKI